MTQACLGKPPSELTLSDAATWAVIARVPMNYADPTKAGQLLDRRNALLERIVVDGSASLAEVDRARQEPLAHCGF
jgi:membrane peptidoglycan carboxypeptidase